MQRWCTGKECTLRRSGGIRLKTNTRRETVTGISASTRRGSWRASTLWVRKDTSTRRWNQAVKCSDMIRSSTMSRIQWSSSYSEIRRLIPSTSSLLTDQLQHFQFEVCLPNFSHRRFIAIHCTTNRLTVVETVVNRRSYIYASYHDGRFTWWVWQLKTTGIISGSGRPDFKNLNPVYTSLLLAQHECVLSIVARYA